MKSSFTARNFMLILESPSWNSKTELMNTLKEQAEHARLVRGFRSVFAWRVQCEDQKKWLDLKHFSSRLQSYSWEPQQFVLRVYWVVFMLLISSTVMGGAQRTYRSWISCNDTSRWRFTSQLLDGAAITNEKLKSVNPKSKSIDFFIKASALNDIQAVVAIQFESPATRPQIDSWISV